eukprot:6213678-Pleurochrysis_carterae.AAC.7
MFHVVPVATDVEDLDLYGPRAILQRSTATQLKRGVISERGAPVHRHHEPVRRHKRAAARARVTYLFNGDHSARMTRSSGAISVSLPTAATPARPQDAFLRDSLQPFDSEFACATLIGCVCLLSYLATLPLGALPCRAYDVTSDENYKLLGSVRLGLTLDYKGLPSTPTFNLLHIYLLLILCPRVLTVIPHGHERLSCLSLLEATESQ